MPAPIQCILFPTDLSGNCLNALEATISLALQHKARIILLHVIAQDPPPDELEEYFSSVLGEENWRAIKAKQDIEHAYDSLVGKMTSHKIMNKVVQQYCQDLGYEEQSAVLDWKEVVVVSTRVDRRILSQAKENECDLIVMGSRNCPSGNTWDGSTIRPVFQNTSIPVMLVP